MNTYIAGNLVDASATFLDKNQNPIDPTTVQIKYKTINVPPDPVTIINYASATVPAPGVVARTSAGNYETLIDTTNNPGYLVWEWIGAGTGQSVEPSSAIVYPASL